MSSGVEDKPPFVLCQEEQELIIALRPYMSADDEGLPLAEYIQLLADRVKEDRV